MRNGELPAEQAIPVCSSPVTINAGFELLVALAVGCVKNLKQIVDCLTEMYYIGTVITSKYFNFKNCFFWLVIFLCLKYCFFFSFREHLNICVFSNF